MSKNIHRVVWQDQKMGELGARGLMFFIHGSQRQQIGGLIGRDEAIEVAKFLGAPLEDEHKTFPREAFLPPDYYSPRGTRRWRCIPCGYCATEVLSDTRTALETGHKLSEWCIVCHSDTMHREEEVQ